MLFSKCGLSSTGKGKIAYRSDRDKPTCVQQGIAISKLSKCERQWVIKVAAWPVAKKYKSWDATQVKMCACWRQGATSFSLWSTQRKSRVREMTSATLWEKKGRVNKVVPVKSLAALFPSMRTYWEGCLAKWIETFENDCKNNWHSREKDRERGWETASLLRDYFSREAAEKGKHSVEENDAHGETCAQGLSTD